MLTFRSFVWDYVPVWLRLFGTTSLFGCACLGLRPCLTSFVWDYVPVWLRLFGTASLFGCAFKPSNKAEGSNFQTKPTGLKLPNKAHRAQTSKQAQRAQTSKQARRAQTKQLCCSNLDLCLKGRLAEDGDTS